MKRVELSLPQVGLIAATRGMLGAGLGLLLADRLGKEGRQAVGWTLVALGAITTIPLVAQVLGGKRRSAESRGGRTLGDGANGVAREPAMAESA